MAVRRFGPVLGAGVSVEEKEAQAGIQPAPYGVTVMVGEFERGLTDRASFLSGEKDFRRRNGGRLATSFAPGAALDFFKLGRGAGELITLRVTGGDEVKSALQLFTRQGTTPLGAASAVKAAVLGGVAGPWALEHGGTLVGSVDRAGNQTATIAAIAATLQNGADETFALANEQTLTVKIDRGAVQTITFLTGEFVDIGAATAEEVAAVIAAKILGAQVSVTAVGARVTITSDTKGTDSYIEVTGGTANVALQFPIVETATTASNVADVNEVTAGELETILEAAWTNSSGVAVTSVGGALRIESNLAGASSYIQVIAASTLDDELGLDNVEHQGSDGTGALASGRKVLGRLIAKNGGKWGGQRKTHLDEITGAGDLTVTTLDTGDAMVENEWAGGTLELKKVSTKTYRIVGNTAAGVISVAADQDLLADWTAGIGTPANRYLLSRDNLDWLAREKSLAIRVVNGQEHPTTEFGLHLYVDGDEVNKWLNLSTDPTKPNYWVTIINKDPSNAEVTAEDLYAGDKTIAAVRPANLYGLSKVLTSLTLTLPDPDVTVNSQTSANPSVTFTRGASVRTQVLTGTVQAGATAIVWTTTLGPLTVNKAAFTGSACDLGPEIGVVTVTNGGTVLAEGDTVVLQILALEPDEAKGWHLWPSAVAKPNLSFVVASNTRSSVTVRTGLDLTDGGTIAAGAPFMLAYPQEFGGGCDSSPVSDADYLAAFDANLSALTRIFGKNKGFVKVATPGLCSTAVTKAALEASAAWNFGYKVEFPSNILTEAAAIDYINTTIGRSEYGCTHFPSWGYVTDPETTPGATKSSTKLVPLVGMVLGREALVARQYDGYHKAPAGIDVTLPDVLELTTGNAETATVLNEEQLNPQGINVIKFRQGTVILWGDRTLSPTSAWQWYHQRCLMSHYENLFRENFDWIVFAINDKSSDERAKTAFLTFLYPEWKKGALRGDKFVANGDDPKAAVNLKIDSENNTDATRAAGDKNAELTLRLADTTERLRVVVGKAGIFDAVV